MSNSSAAGAAAAVVGPMMNLVFDASTSIGGAIAASSAAGLLDTSATLLYNTTLPDRLVVAPPLTTSPKWNHPLLGVVLLTVTLITIFGNTLVICAVIRERSLKSVTNYYIVSLAVADLIVGLVVMPFNSLNKMTNDFWFFGDVWCDIWHSIDVCASTASINSLLFIALDRHSAISDPISYHTSWLTRYWLLFVALIWICSACISFPAIAYWRWITKEYVLYQCVFPDDIYYLVFSSLVSFYIPLSIMIIVYFRIYRAATRQINALKTGQKLNVKSSDGTALTLRIHRGGYHKVDTNMSESNTANNLASTNHPTNANANHHSLSKTKTLTMSHINHHQQQSSSPSKNSPNKSSHRTHSLTVEAQSKALFHRSKPTNNLAKMPIIKSNSKEDIFNQNTNIQLTTRPKLQPSIERRARLVNKTNRKKQRRSKSTGDLRPGEARSTTATTKRRVKSCHSNINTQKIKLNLSSLATLKLNNNINKKKNCSSSVRVKNTTTDNGNSNHHRFSPMTAQHRDASFSSMSSLFLSNRVKPINFLYYPTLISKSKSSKSQLDVDECQTSTNITAELTKLQPESTKSNQINNNNNNNNNNNEILSGNVDKPDQQRQQLQNMDNLYDLIIETNRSRSQSVDEENIFHENLAYLRQIGPNPVTNDPQNNSVTGRLSVVGSERVKRTNSQMVEPLESSLGMRVFSSIKNKLRKSSTATVPKTTAAPQEPSADTGLLDDQLLANISMKKLDFYRQHYIEHNNLAPKSAHSPVNENNDHDYQLSTTTTTTTANRNISRLKNFFSLRRKQTPRATTGRMRNDSMFSSIYSNNSSMPAVTYEFGNSKCRPGAAKMTGHEAMYNGAIRSNDAKAAAPKTTKNLIAKKVKGLSLTKKLSKFSREQKAAKTLGIVMGVFIICWLPFFIYNVITGIFKASLSSSHEFIYSVFTWFGYLNSGCNPIIYAFSSRDFRRAFYKILFPARFMRNKKKAFKRAAANYNNSLTTGATLQSQKMNACRLNSTSINNSQLNAHSQLEPHNSSSLRQPVVCVTCQTYENLVMSQIAQQKQSKSQAQFRSPQLNVPASKVPEYSLIKCKITNRGTIPDEAKDVRLNLDELELIKLKLVRSPGDNQEPIIGEQTCAGLFSKSVGESIAVDESSNAQSTTPIRLAGKLRDEPHGYGKRHESMPANLPINNMKLTENKAASSSFSSSILVSPSRRPTKSIYGLARNIRRRLHGMLLNGAASRRSTSATSSSNNHHNHNVSLNINNSHIKIVGMSKYRYNPSYYNTHVRRMSSSSLMSSISLNLMKNNSIPNNSNTANNAANSAAVSTTNSRDYPYARKLTSECVKCQKPAPIVPPQQQQQQQQQQPLPNSRSQSPSSVRSMSSTSINMVKKKNGMIAVGTKFVFNKPVANDSSTIKTPSNYNRCEFFSSYYDWKCADNNNNNNNNNNLHETTYHLLNTTNCCNINDPATANMDDLNYRNFSLYDDDDDDYLNQINSKIRKTQLSNGK